MKPTNILASDDFLIETGTGTREKYYQNRLRKYIKEGYGESVDSEDGVEAEGHSNIQKKRSKFDVIISKGKLGRKADMLAKKHKTHGVFQTEDINLNIKKICAKETKIQKLVFGREFRKKVKSLYELERTNEMLIPPFYAWVHLSCGIFMDENYLTDSSLAKIAFTNSIRFTKQGYICKRSNRKNIPQNMGATVRGSQQDGEYWFHVEGARRRGKDLTYF